MVTEEQEIDNIFILLTYALVYKNWQLDKTPRSQRRGYNIAALLVNEKNEPVFHGLNTIASTNNSTHHSEINAMLNYMKKYNDFDLDGFKVYVSLQPCIMCLGMMMMTKVKKIVYGQNDDNYSNIAERLALDTTAIGGYSPYPRNLIIEPSKLKYKTQLDDAFKEFQIFNENKILAVFLCSEVARLIYYETYTDFLNLTLKHSSNLNIYEKAQTYFENYITFIS